jgi:ribosomal protein L40E
MKLGQPTTGPNSNPHERQAWFVGSCASRQPAGRAGSALPAGVQAMVSATCPKCIAENHITAVDCRRCGLDLHARERRGEVRRPPPLRSAARPPASGVSLEPLPRNRSVPVRAQEPRPCGVGACARIRGRRAGPWPAQFFPWRDAPPRPWPSLGGPAQVERVERFVPVVAGRLRRPDRGAVPCRCAWLPRSARTGLRKRLPHGGGT